MSHPARTSGRGRGERDRGAVLFIVALTLPVLLILTAFAVDLGRQRAARRTMQARADVIALDLARLIDGRTEDQMLADAGTEAAAIASAARNGIERAKITYEFGRWTDSGIGDEGTFNEILGNVVPTAVRVRAQDEIDYFFQPGTGKADRSAIATSRAEATFQIGSKLASVNTQQATLLNGVLGQALNTNFALSALTYQGLVGSTITLSQLATQMGFASPTELADANVSARDLFLASASALEQDGDTAAANVFNTIALQTDEDAVVDMGDLMFVAAGGGRSSAGEASVDAFNLLSGTAYAINGSEAISVPNLSLAIPNVLTSHLNMHVIQKAQIITGPVGVFGDTSQADLGITNQLTTSGVPIVGGLLRVTGTVTLRQTLASARGTLTNIACGANQAITVGVTPQPVATIADLTLDIRTLLGIPVATITTGLSASPVGQSAGGTFDYPDEFLPDVGTGTMLEAPTSPLGLTNLLQVKSTDVNVLGLPLGVSLASLVSGVNTLVLNPVISNLDTLITGPLSTALGLSVGAADIGAVDMTCSNVQLVG